MWLSKRNPYDTNVIKFDNSHYEACLSLNIIINILFSAWVFGFSGVLTNAIWKQPKIDIEEYIP